MIALRLGQPPSGYANGSLRLLAEHVVEIGIVDAVVCEGGRPFAARLEWRLPRHSGMGRVDGRSQCPDEDRVVRSARYPFERAVYEITAPEFDEVIIKFDPRYYSGKAFIVKVYNNSEDNCYIQKAELNGKPLNNCWFYHRDFVQGGTLELWLGF